MPNFGHYDAFVEVDGVRLPEYDVVTKRDTPNGVPIVSCWVPSESGKTFEISCDNIQRPRDAITCTFTVDGVATDNRVLRADHGPYARITRSKCTLDFLDTPRGRRTLVFANIELSDDDALLGAAVPAQLGEIRICVQPIVVTSYGPPPPRAVPAVPIALSAGRMHERTKKAGMHSVELGAVSTQPQSWIVSTTNVGPPAVEFVLRYRPLALLQAQGIAPLPTRARASASPGPAQWKASPDVRVKREDDVDMDAANEQEIRRLQEQIETLKKKRKRSSDGVTIKAEPSVQRLWPSSPNEVIDLTCD